MTVPLIQNPNAPTGLFSRLVVNGACSGTVPKTDRYAGCPVEGLTGTLTEMTSSSDWRFIDQLNRYGLYVPRSTGRIIWPYRASMYDATSMAVAFWIKFDSVNFSGGNGYIFSQWDPSAKRQWAILAEAANPAKYGIFVSADGVNAESGYTTTTVATSWVHVAVNFRARKFTDWFFDGSAGTQNLSTTGVGLTFANLSSDAHAALLAGSANRGPAAEIADLLWRVGGLWTDEERMWLADPANRLYIPDTRRVFYVPSGVPPVAGNMLYWLRGNKRANKQQAYSGKQ
jgi:hypothetical protein